MTKLASQIAFLRERFPNDGAEGETVWAVAEAAERLAAQVRELELELSEQRTLAAINASGCDRALKQMETATAALVAAQTAHIAALEGGIVAENARVVKEHNELRAKLAAVTEAREASETAFARFISEVVEALGEDSQDATSSMLTLNRIRALLAECDSHHLGTCFANRPCPECETAKKRRSR